MWGRVGPLTAEACLLLGALRSTGSREGNEWPCTSFCSGDFHGRISSSELPETLESVV